MAFRVKGRNIPIVHRVIEVHDDPLFLTKGDVNPVDDRGLYPKGQRWLSESEVVGRVVGYFP